MMKYVIIVFNKSEGNNLGLGEALVFAPYNILTDLHKDKYKSA